MNKWQEFAELHGMSNKQFSEELIECAQAVLAIELKVSGSEALQMISGQNDGVYQLDFKRIIK